MNKHNRKGNWNPHPLAGLYKRTEKIRNKISKSRIEGIKSGKIKLVWIGKKHKKSSKLKISLKQRGDKSVNWKGGISQKYLRTIANKYGLKRNICSFHL